MNLPHLKYQSHCLNINMRSILVTGGCGFIGSNFIQYTLQKNSQLNIINLDKLTYAGRMINLSSKAKERYFFIKGDICNKDLVDSLFKKYEFQSVIHFAAESHVDRSIDGPEKFVNTNILGTLNLLEHSRKYLENLKITTFGFYISRQMKFLEL